MIEGGIGEDALDGGAGSDTVSYKNSEQKVVVNLGTNENSGGDAEGDTLLNFENIIGSKGDDTLTGDDGDNVLEGGAGRDLIRGGAGDDILQGGEGFDSLDGGSNNLAADGGKGDTVSYEDEQQGVLVDLENQIALGATDNRPLDRIRGFENAIGSDNDDTLTGDDNANTLTGGKGADTLEGQRGDDILQGGEGADIYNYYYYQTGRRDGKDTINDADGTNIRIHLRGPTLTRGIVGQNDQDLFNKLQENGIDFIRIRETDQANNHFDYLQIQFSENGITDTENYIRVSANPVHAGLFTLTIVVGTDEQTVSASTLMKNFVNQGYVHHDTLNIKNEFIGVLAGGVGGRAVDTVSY